jgi:hypothetical protein
MFCPGSESLWKAELKSNWLIHQVEKISMHPSTQAVSWVLLAAFRQLYNENWEKKVKQKDLKDLELSQKKWWSKRMWLLKRVVSLTISQESGTVALE